MISPKKQIHRHIPVKHGGRNSFVDNPKIIDFSSNISPLGFSNSVKSILKNKMDKIKDYPDVESSKLLKELEKYTKVSKSHLLVGNGATEIIYNFCNAFLSQNIPVLIPIPTFGEYESAAKLNQGKITHFKSMELSYDLDEFLEKIPKKGCIFICNPNNPTGSLLSKYQMERILHECKKKSSFLFVDECFIELTPNRNESIISKVKNYKNLLILRSLTKSFGLAGIRLGYAISDPKIISILKKIKIPWSVNVLAQETGYQSLKNLSHIQKTNNLIKKESDYLKRNISKIPGFHCLDSTTNFILIKTDQSSTNLQKKLLKKNILIRDCKNFPGLNNRYIRIAVKTRKENYKLIKALEKL